MGSMARRMQRAARRAGPTVGGPRPTLSMDFMVVDAEANCSTQEMRDHRAAMLEVAREHGVTVVERFSPEWEKLVEMGLARR